MKYLALILLSWIMVFQGARENYVCKNARISLFSSAPLEDIDAVTDKGTSVFNASTGVLAFSVPIKSLQFEKSLMREHFNENYMESDKYPNAVFKGRIQENPNLSKDGTYPVHAAGVLDVHGVKQNRNISGRIVVKGGKVRMLSEFVVKCKDHDIEIPRLVFQKIAETIQIKVVADYTSLK